MRNTVLPLAGGPTPAPITTTAFIRQPSLLGRPAHAVRGRAIGPDRAPGWAISLSKTF